MCSLPRTYRWLLHLVARERQREEGGTEGRRVCGFESFITLISCVLWEDIYYFTINLWIMWVKRAPIMYWLNEDKATRADSWERMSGCDTWKRGQVSDWENVSESQTKVRERMSTERRLFRWRRMLLLRLLLRPALSHITWWLKRGCGDQPFAPVHEFNAQTSGRLPWRVCADSLAFWWRKGKFDSKYWAVRAIPSDIKKVIYIYVVKHEKNKERKTTEMHGWTLKTKISYNIAYFLRTSRAYCGRMWLVFSSTCS